MNARYLLITLTTGAALTLLIGVGSLTGASTAQAGEDEADGEQIKIRRASRSLRCR